MKRTPAKIGALLCLIGLALAENGLAATLLTEADATAPRLINTGENIELRLSENPSTGYVWSLAFDPPDSATILGDHFTAKGDRIGASGAREWSIAINRTGAIVVRAKIWRPWEGEASVTKRLEFRVEAR
jgi:inhibitor of cysteine peptidase